MTPARRKGPRASHTLSWRPDARECLGALLPELAVSIVAATCLSAVMAFDDGVGIPALVMVMGIMQVLVQGTLYVFTYLLEDDSSNTKAYWFWPLVGLCTLYGVILPMFWGLPSVSESTMQFQATLASGMGIVLFYVTRTRPTFVMLLLEMLVLAYAVSDHAGLLLVHAIGVGAVAALFVMRSSATRITSDGVVDDPGSEASRADGRQLPRLGMYAQVAVLAVAVGALCLALALGGAAVMQRASGTGEAWPGTGDAPASEPVGAAQGRPSDGAQATAGAAQGGQHVEVASTGSGGIRPSGSAVALLLLALIALPVPTRLLLRRLTRLSLSREPRAADRAARVYLGIISRLEAAGIMRDEAQTPLEFLVGNAQELEELTAPTGLSLDDWTVLTATYEKARYADLDPTESELGTCWRLYDALPACTREAVGWRRYLLGAFWRM